jgi:ankyrin repeat protein
MIGSMKPNARIVSELLEHGADPAIIDKSQRNCLHHALLRKRRAVVKVIMKYVGDDIVMARNKDGFTCLELASTQGTVALAQRQIKHASHSHVLTSPLTLQRSRR